ncbi:hypothetical protein [Roseomonas sp. BN140053]|uniref:hypothetical protein n=1 Tax=Roseomonas sp. BN140053 TaxID=3391898 RepID=UPI0039EC72CF
MGFTPRLPPGLFRSLSESHPRLRAAAAHLETLGIPRARATALLRSLMVHVMEDLGASWLRDVTARLERIEGLRNRLGDAVAHVVENGILPEGMDVAGFSALLAQLEREMDGLASARRHAETMNGAATGERVVAGAASPAGAPPATGAHPHGGNGAPRPGAVSPHPPESLAAAMDAARASHPRGAALIDRLVADPELGDRLGLALAAENRPAQLDRLRELGEAAGLTEAELADLTRAVEAMGVARHRMEVVDPAALARRRAAVAGFPEALAKDCLGDNTILGPLAESNRGQVLVYWRRWREGGAKGSFRDYVRAEMGSEIRPTMSEWSATFNVGGEPGAMVLKDPAAFDPGRPGNRRVNPREPGTDLLVRRANGDLWYVDDKAHRGRVPESTSGAGGDHPGGVRSPVALSGVSALELPRFLANLRDDIAEIEAAMLRQRGAGHVPDPAVGDSLARLRAAADELEAASAGWGPDDHLRPENLRAVRSILDRHRIRLRVTSELGDVAAMTSRLEGLGIRVVPPIGGRLR